MEQLQAANIPHLSGFLHSDYASASPLQMPPCICLSPAPLPAPLPAPRPQMSPLPESTQQATAHATGMDTVSKAEITKGIKQHFLANIAALDTSIAAGSKVRLSIDREPSATDLIPAGHNQAVEPVCANEQLDMNNGAGPAAADAAQAETVAPAQSFTFSFVPQSGRCVLNGYTFAG